MQDFLKKKKKKIKICHLLMWMSCESHTPHPVSALGQLSRLSHMATGHKSRARGEIFHLCSSAHKQELISKHWQQRQENNHTEGPPQGKFDWSITSWTFHTKKPLGMFASGTEQKAHNLCKHPVVQTAMSPAFQTYNCGLPCHGSADKKSMWTPTERQTWEIEGFQSWFLQGPHAN